MSKPRRSPAAPILGALSAKSLPQLESDLLIEEAELTDPQWAATDTEFVELRQVRLDGGSLADSRWYRTQWSDVAGRGTDLANANLVEAGLRRIQLQEARATGLSVAGCRVDDLQVANSLADYSNWRQATLHRGRFTDCRMSGADFSEATLRDVDFDGCDLSGVNFRSARLERVRFGNCRLDGLIGIDALAGTTIETTDLPGLAAALAAALGIVVVAPGGSG